MPPPEAAEDPIYAASDYAAEFFATVQQEFASLVDDPDYTALLDMYGTHLLFHSGSRPEMRQSGEWSGAPAMRHPSELRAIPNNGILQQLGFLANTLFGVGRAIAKDRDTFFTMREVQSSSSISMSPSQWTSRSTVKGTCGVSSGCTRDPAQMSARVPSTAMRGMPVPGTHSSGISVSSMTAVPSSA